MEQDRNFLNYQFKSFSIVSLQLVESQIHLSKTSEELRQDLSVSSVMDQLEEVQPVFIQS